MAYEVAVDLASLGNHSIEGIRVMAGLPSITVQWVNPDTLNRDQDYLHELVESIRHPHRPLPLRHLNPKLDWEKDGF